MPLRFFFATPLPASHRCFKALGERPVLWLRWPTLPWEPIVVVMERVCGISVTKPIWSEVACL